MVALKELALGADGDLAFDAQGRLYFKEGAAAVAQWLQVRLKAIATEWVFDQNLGTPWLTTIVGGKPNLPIVRSILSQRIVETAGVERIDSFDLTFDRTTRVLTATGRVKAESEDGTVTFSADLGVF